MSQKTISNGEKGLSVRNSINENFTELYSQNNKKGIVSIKNFTDKAPQTFTTSLSKLLFSEAGLTINIGSKFTVNETTSEITCLQDGYIKIFGEMSVEFEATKEFRAYPTLNNVQLPIGKFLQGQGAGKPVQLNCAGVIAVSAGDIFTIWGKAELLTLDLVVKTACVQLEYIEY